MGSGAPPIRVYLCDDVVDLRLLVRATLARVDGIDVIGEAGDGHDCLAGVIDSDPDVVVLDLALPGLDGLELIARIRAARPDVRLLVFSGYDVRRLGTTVEELGADRYLEKGGPLETLVAAVRELASA